MCKKNSRCGRKSFVSLFYGSRYVQATFMLYRSSRLRVRARDIPSGIKHYTELGLDPEYIGENTTTSTQVLYLSFVVSNRTTTH